MLGLLRTWPLVLLAGCAGSKAATVEGTVVYSELGTQDIRILDVATGKSQLVDPGELGAVSIAPDGQHVAYQGIDQVIKVSDRAGNVTPLVPSGGCAGASRWVSSSVMTYCISTSQERGTMVMPALGSSPRFVSGDGVVVSPDGSLDAFVAQGNVVVENIDGSGRRALAMYRDIAVAGFTPDQSKLIVTDFSTSPTRMHLVSLADATSIDLDGVWFDASPFGPTTILGASDSSPDGTEILARTTTDLVALSFSTGMTRVIAPLPDKITYSGAAFLDADHVLWVRSEDLSMGDIGIFKLSVHVAGPTPTDDVVIDAPSDTNVVIPTIAVAADGLLMLASDVLVARTDGTVLFRNTNAQGVELASDLLGLAPDGEHAIAISSIGQVRIIGVDGTARDLVVAGGDETSSLGPFAAYAQGH